MAEIRVYNGLPVADWLSWEGEYFRSPRGEPFVGDLDLDGVLRIDGLALEGFVEPSACAADARSSLVLVPDYETIDLGSAADGFGFTATMLDPATCRGVDLGPYTVEGTVGDETVATAREANIGGATDEDTTRWEITRVGPGSTSFELTVIDRNGAVVAAATVPVEVS